MMEQSPSTLIAVFEDFGHAEAALGELLHAGFHQEQIGILAPGGCAKPATTPEGRTEENAGRGAVAGAVTGGALGTVAGALMIGLVPGIGPILGGGLLLGVALGGAAGAAVGSYLGPFLALGFSKEEATGFAGELKAGRTIVTVKAEDRPAEALTILRAHGGHDGNLAHFADAEAPQWAHLQS